MSGTAVAIYARISQDRDGDQLAVGRQLQDCRAEVDRLGWTVAEEYVHDDVSAWSGKRRPAYERMLSDLIDGRIDAIVAWHLDRLYRNPMDLEQLLAVCSRIGVKDLRTVHGSFDLASGDGMLQARVLVAVAANESDSKRRRGKRKALEIAESGAPHAGGIRPFGFKPNRIDHDPEEAKVIRQLAVRALAGESLPSLGRWLHDHEVRTVTGKTWRTPVIRQLLLNRRLCGIRVHNGVEVGQAAWEPIISVEQSDALHRLLTAPERRTNRSARSYLLSGMCRCSRCGNKLHSVRRYETRRYLCRSGVDGNFGCGKISVSAEPVERIIAAAVLMRLDSPELEDALAGRVRDDSEAVRLYAEITADTEQLSALMEMWTNRETDLDLLRRSRATIEQRRADSRSRLASLAGTRDLETYRGHGERLREDWSSLNLDRQRAVVKSLVDHVEILPGVMGARQVAIDRVRPVWRF